LNRKGLKTSQWSSASSSPFHRPLGLEISVRGLTDLRIFLAQGKQTYWQILPLNPTDQAMGNSPYSSPSAFAGNPLLISPELLVESGLLSKGDLTEKPFSAGRCDYAAMIPNKMNLLHRAYERFGPGNPHRHAYEEFCINHSTWLEDFALYMVIKNHSNGIPWRAWESTLRDRNPGALEKVRRSFPDELEQEKFLQYLFFEQWLCLKRYCNERRIQLIGDLPIYVNYDSADVWRNNDLFKLDGDKNPLAVAGVPPDYFSRTGQFWGNPIYRWEVLRETGYQWWFQRIGHNLQLLDIIRIDHFRGFVGFWEIPAGEKTAVNGQWVEAPAADLFPALLSKFPGISIIAEDLGFITSDVREMMERFGFPGMRVLQFAFGDDQSDHPFLPHNYVPNTIVYTGTHDNNTTRGWFENDASAQERSRLLRYLGKDLSGERVPKELIRLAMMSVANTAIIPMQDLLGLGEDARMNFPSTTHGNWEWRLLQDQFKSATTEWFLEMTETYGRAT
jgi:4-alpha-glucanotransferase